jgi:hypothetical protein
MEPGYVFMTIDEMTAMADHLGQRLPDFRSSFDIEWDASMKRWAIDATSGRGCPLLTEDLRCSVHPVKPAQCRTFPFWRELLGDEESWEAAKKYCPGMDAPKGRVYSAKEIERIRDEERGT